MSTAPHRTVIGRLLSQGCLDLWERESRHRSTVRPSGANAPPEPAEANGDGGRDQAAGANAPDEPAPIDPERVRRLATARASLPDWPRTVAEEEHDLLHRLARVCRQGTDQAEEWLVRRERRVAADSKEAA